MKARAAGLSLIELIVAIVIISAVGTTVLGLVASTSRTSTEAMAQSQRAAIAKAYLDEILSKSFICTDPTPGRQNYDCIQDYAGIVDEPVTDRFGNAIGFPGFTVTVTLSATSGLTIAGMSAVPTAQRRRVTVRVDDPFGGRTDMTGVKTLHP